jgi:hypothetical protein
VQCLGYLSESLETCEIAPEPSDQNGRALFERLQILDLAEQLSRRVLDLKKNLNGAAQELSVSGRALPPSGRGTALTAVLCVLASPSQTLVKMADYVAEQRQSRSLERISVNTGTALVLNETNEKSARALEILYVVAYLALFLADMQP